MKILGFFVLSASLVSHSCFALADEVQNPPAGEVLLSEQSMQQAFQKGLQAAKVGDLSVAEQIWQTLAEHPNLPASLRWAVVNNLSVIDIRQKRYEQAKQRLEKSLGSDAKIATTLENLNQLYAYEAQLAYKEVFAKTVLEEPRGQWLSLENERLEAKELISVKQQATVWLSALEQKNWQLFEALYEPKTFISPAGNDLQAWQKITEKHFAQYASANRWQMDAILPLTSEVVRVQWRVQSPASEDSALRIQLWQKIPSAESAKANPQWKIVQELML